MTGDTNYTHTHTLKGWPAEEEQQHHRELHKNYAINSLGIIFV